MPRWSRCPGTKRVRNWTADQLPDLSGKVYRIKRSRAHATVSALLATSLCIMGPDSRAHLPEAFGHEYVRAEDMAAQVTPAPNPRPDLPEASPLDLAAYLLQVKDREHSGGPYANGLTEPLTLLGLYHHQRGDYDSARAAYQRALHIARINDGLTSERQLPILRDLIAVYKLLGDYESLGGAYRYYQRVRGLGRPPYDRQVIRDSLEYLQWQRDAYSMRPDGKERRHLLQAYRANREILQTMATEPEIAYDWYRDLTLSQMKNLYLLMGTKPMQLMPAGTFGGNGGPDEAVDREVARIQQTAMVYGKLLLEDLINRSQQRPASELAAVHLELGDWLQWNGEYRRARKQYAQVVAVLQAAGEQQLLSSWLDQPMELPDERSLWRQPPELADLRPLVTVSYKVSSRGEASAIRVEAVDGTHGAAGMRLKRLLRETHFRPRFSQGKAERSGQVTRRYRLLD